MDKQRILNNVVKDKNGCWIWSKSLTSEGYGQLSEGKKYWTAHRYSYTCFIGDIPPGLVIRHSCHNRACCNPNHLTVGTHKDNYHDSKDTYDKVMSKRRKKWIVNGKSYNTCREVVNELGISMNAVIKHSQDGVFNVDTYRQSCKKAGVNPKI